MLSERGPEGRSGTLLWIRGGRTLVRGEGRERQGVRLGERSWGGGGARRGGSSLEEDEVLDDDVNHENGDDVPGAWERGVV